MQIVQVRVMLAGGLVTLRDTVATSWPRSLRIPRSATVKLPPPQRQKSGHPVCAGCHEDKHASIALTHHGAKNDATGSMCQACHGDASEHLKDPAKKSRRTSSSKGTAGGEERRLPDLPRAQPPPRVLGVGQALEERRRVLQLPQHPRQAADAARRRPTRRPRGRSRPTPAAPATSRCATPTLKPSHHPIIEGKVKCSDCHNPHGALTPGDAQARDGEPAVLLVPRRQARAVRLRPSAGRGELPLLPHAARLVARASC